MNSEQCSDIDIWTTETHPARSEGPRACTESAFWPKWTFLNKFLTVGVTGGSSRCGRGCSGAESSPRWREDIQRSSVSRENVSIWPQPEALSYFTFHCQYITNKWSDVRVTFLTWDYHSLMLTMRTLNDYGRLLQNTKEFRWKVQRMHRITLICYLHQHPAPLSPHLQHKGLIQ